MNKKQRTSMKTKAVFMMLLYSVLGHQQAFSAPSAVACPQMTTNTRVTCTYRANPNEQVYVWPSNNAIGIASNPPGSYNSPGLGLVVYTPASGYGKFDIYSLDKKGQVTVCVRDVSGAFKSCSITRVN
jgi:hypothetical protein